MANVSFDKNVDYHRINSKFFRKLFTYTDSTYNGILNIIDAVSPQSDSVSALEVSSSLYFFSISQLYYNNTISMIGKEYTYQDIFCLSENSRIVSIPNKLFRKRIYPGTFTITDLSTGSIDFRDDGYGNLYNYNQPTGSIVSDKTLNYWYSFDDGYVTKYLPYKKIYKSKNNKHMKSPIELENPKFSSGISGSGYMVNFLGNGYGKISDSLDLNFDGDKSFLISMWVSCPPTQLITSSEVNTIIAKRDGIDSQYPYSLEIYNHTSVNNGKLVYKVKDTKGREASVTSSISINDGIFRHIAIGRESGSLQLYIDGNLNSSNDNKIDDCRNSSCVFLASHATSSRTSIDPSSYFSGSIDELRIYDGFVTASSQYALNLYNVPFNTNIVGNIFYEHGLVVINNLSGSFNNILKGTGNNGFTMKFRGEVDSYHHEIKCTINRNEFNFTMNPSVRLPNSTELTNDIYSTLNYFDPYYTAVGLYTENNELVVIAKFREAIKSYSSVPVSFTVSFDA